MAAVPLLGSIAPNVQASRWLPMITYLQIRQTIFNFYGFTIPTCHNAEFTVGKFDQSANRGTMNSVEQMGI